jgi:membrane-bound serine protease (ClpP class)
MHRMTKSNARNVAQACWWRTLLLQLLLVCTAEEFSQAQEAEAPAGAANAAAPPADDKKGPDKSGLATLVEVKLPLGSGGEAPLKQIITRARDRLIAEARLRGDGRRPILVLNFVPTGGAEGAGSQFETVLSLARFLESREMADVKTVAWIPRTIRGHGVLAAIACEEIVMAADAEVGDASADEPADQAVSRTVVEAYREIADAKRTIPVALAVGMIDPAVEVVQIESEEGVRFLLRDEVEAFRADNEVISEQTLVPAGSVARFTGREGRQFGFVKYLAAEKPDVAKALSTPVEALEVNQSLLADWEPVMITVRGEITPGAVSQLSTLLNDNVAGGANWIGVRIDSVGGDLDACITLANQLAELDPNAVRTVAYVPVEAKGGAALIALACDQLVMAPDAVIGIEPNLAEVGREDNRNLPQQPRRRRGFKPRDEEDPAALRASVASAEISLRSSLAAKTDRSWSLLTAMIDPNVELFQYRHKETGETRWMGPEEASELRDAANWTQGAALHAGAEPLVLRGTQALDSGIAFQTVDSFDQLERLYGLNQVAFVEPNWAMKLVHALASPGLATFLLMLGLVGMYIEMKTPGVGVGGVVAALAFLLFFWSKSLEGTATSLEIVMFVGGLVLMLIEIFVVPGVGVFGLTGGLMVIFSLVLASQTFTFPRSGAEMDEMRRSMSIVVGAGIGVIGLAIALRRFLPKAPLFNRLVLEPPPPEERITLSHREALADYSHLIGVTGEAMTDLRPGGRALIGGQLIDVIAEGIPLDRGTPVTVVEAHANRVLVRAAT